jgi:Zn-dependent peptidase ImmA (M78 family)
MTYIPDAVLEARAAELWRTYHLDLAFDCEQLVDLLGLGLVWEEIDDGDGPRILGLLDPSHQIVVLNQRHLEELEANGGRLRRYTLSHEIGHWVFHADAIRSGTLNLVESGRIWCRDGSRDPIERQAEMFAARLLIPRDRLRDHVPQRPWTGWRPVYRLADIFLVSVTSMMIRLEELGWAHRSEDGEPQSGPAPVRGQSALF